MGQYSSATLFEGENSWCEYLRTTWELRDGFLAALRKPSTDTCMDATELLVYVGTAKPEGYEDVSSYGLLEELKTREIKLLQMQAEQLNERGNGNHIFERMLALHVVVDMISQQLVQEDRTLPYK